MGLISEIDDVVQRNVIVEDDDAVGADGGHAVIRDDHDVDAIGEAAAIEAAEQAAEITVSTADGIATAWESGPAACPA